MLLIANQFSTGGGCRARSLARELAPKRKRMAAAAAAAKPKPPRPPKRRNKKGGRRWLLCAVVLMFSLALGFAFQLRPEWLQSLQVMAGLAKPRRAAAAARKPSVRQRSAATRVFERTVVPLVMDYVFGRFDDFAASKLTFRDLKLHLAESINVPYEELKNDELSEVIEDVVDVIANKCDGGSIGAEKCAKALGYDLAKQRATRASAPATGASVVEEAVVDSS